jgi:elongation factor Ts
LQACSGRERRRLGKGRNDLAHERHRDRREKGHACDKGGNRRLLHSSAGQHIAAAHPLYVSRADVPGNLIEAEREIYKAQVQGKPAHVADKIVEGKLEKFYTTVCLLEQGFIKNPDVTMSDLLNSKIAELGENIIIRRFVRYLVGEPLPSEA